MKKYEICMEENGMPLDDNGELLQFATEQNAIDYATGMGLVEGVDYIVTWFED
jgi:hypothetical protein